MAGTSRWVDIHVNVALLVPEKPHLVQGKSGKCILLLRTPSGAVHCLDAFCFHQGGNLASADVVDIEEFGTALRCPNHGYYLRAETGEWLQRDGAMFESRGVRQRPRPVRVDPASGAIHVDVGDTPATHIASDEYNTPEQGSGSCTTPRMATETIAFRARKRRAVAAIEKRTGLPATAHATENQSVQLATQTAFRQLTLKSMFERASQKQSGQMEQ